MTNLFSPRCKLFSTACHFLLRGHMQLVMSYLNKIFGKTEKELGSNIIGNCKFYSSLSKCLTVRFWGWVLVCLGFFWGGGGLFV